jgi:zinc/manganese transport system permease protein
MTFWEIFIQPFVEFAFMQRALIGSIALALGCAPLGTFLMLRRMSLMGDAIAHGLLPGVAAGFLLAGFSVPAMSLGGLLAGITMALAAGALSRVTRLREDASLAAFYLVSLALGVVMVSARGSNVDLLHLLFGAVLALDHTTLLLVSGVTSITLAGLALIYRPLVAECFDPGFLRAIGGRGSLAHMGFLVLVVLNLVGGFQAMGTLMAVGLMMLPAIVARLWASTLEGMMAIAIMVAMISGYTGLLLSFHAGLPSGPAIVLMAGAGLLVSLLAGRFSSMRAWLRTPTHTQG